MSWHTYIIKCSDGKLYTGITNNLTKRIQKHNSGNGGRFTRFRRPVELVYSEETATKSQALKRESQVKHLERIQKIALIKAS